MSDTIFWIFNHIWFTDPFYIVAWKFVPLLEKGNYIWNLKRLNKRQSFNGRITLKRDREHQNRCYWESEREMPKRKGSKAVHDPETLISKSKTLDPVKDDFEEEEEEQKAKDQRKGFFACYLLTSLCPRFKGHTYIGWAFNSLSVSSILNFYHLGYFVNHWLEPWSYIFLSLYYLKINGFFFIYFQYVF